MAKPRVFVSSTYYDLKHIRSSMEVFIDALGYEPVLSEKGDIAYMSDQALDESCYREAAAADIFVLVIGGRYGSEISGEKKRVDRSFFEHYESVTKKEFETAHNSDIPIYILIESGVYAEYQTFLRNKDRTDISYAHVDSVNVFKLVEDILSKPRNNAILPFERYSEIEGWLRDQWAGLFREFLRKKNEQQQLSALSGQIGDLKTVSETLKTYMEAVLTSSNPRESGKIIASEDKRLEDAGLRKLILRNSWVNYTKSALDISEDKALELVRKPRGWKEAIKNIAVANSERKERCDEVAETLRTNHAAQTDFNIARASMGLKTFKVELPNDQGF